MSKCKYNGEIKLSQQSRIATSNEEEKTEEMPVNKSEMWSWEIRLEKIKKSDLAICLQKGGEEKKEEKHWKSVKQCQWKVALSDPTEKMPVHKSEMWSREIWLPKIKKSDLAICLQKGWPNWRVGVRGPQWPSEFFKIVSKWQNWKPIHDWIQFCWAF